MPSYSNRFVMLVLVNGRPIQERKDGTIPIPFGSQYTLVFKNKHNRRAKVQFWIDGNNESGTGFIIPAKGSIEIKRHSDKDEAFKVVELTSEEALAEGKGENIDGEKGVIEAKFYLEKPPIRLPKIPKVLPMPYPYPYPYPVYPPEQSPWQSPWRPNKPWYPGYNYTTETTVYCSNSLNAETISNLSEPVSKNATKTDLFDCATVRGDTTGQAFVPEYFNSETDYVVIKVVLRGYKPEVMLIVDEEVIYCTNCGQKKSRKHDKFCGKCGQRY